MMKLSLKKKFSIAFAVVAAVMILICSFSAYTYEVLLDRVYNVSDSLSELNEFRYKFGQYNENLTEYFENGDSGSLENCSEIRDNLSEICSSIESKYSGSDDEIESSLADSISSNFTKYVQQTSELLSMEDRDEAYAQYTEKYSLNAGYISGYIEKLISTRYRAGSAEKVNVQNRIIVFKSFLAVVLLAFVLLMTATGFLIIRKVVNPLEILSRQSKQISGFDFDIDINIPDTGDEIEELSRSFSEMKDSLKESFETNQKNVQILDDMLVRFEGNSELMQYIGRQREISDGIFRQANVDRTSGLMNGKAFERCLNSDIKNISDDDICVVSVVELINYDEISREVYEGTDDLVRMTVKKLKYITGNEGYMARWDRNKFIMFFPDASNLGNIEEFSRNLKNAADSDFVYRKVRKHIDVRVNTIISQAPKSEKFLINYVVNGTEDVKPGGFKVTRNNIL